MRLIRAVLALLCASVFSHGQALPYVPRAVAAYVSPGGTGASGTWYAMTGSGSSPIPYVPYAEGIYVSIDGTGNVGTWVPWTGSSGGAPTTCALSNNYICANTNNIFTGSNTFGSSGGSQITAVYGVNGGTGRFRVWDGANVQDFYPSQMQTNNNFTYYTTNTSYFAWAPNLTEALRLSNTGGLSLGDSTFNATNPGAGNFSVKNAISSATYLGPVVAPSGACSINGAWVFSQDGHATFCNAGTWATKI